MPLCLNIFSGLDALFLVLFISLQCCCDEFHSYNTPLLYALLILPKPHAPHFNQDTISFPARLHGYLDMHET